MRSEQVEIAAQAAHEANRSYCIAIGDDSQTPWPEAPEWQKASARLGVRFIVDHPGVGPRASHDSWLAEKKLDGWKYGPIKNVETKEHPCFVSYDQLHDTQKAKDAIFTAVVCGVIAHFAKN